MNTAPDPIREAAAARAADLGLSPVQVAALCPAGPDRSSVHRYLTGRAGLTTRNAALVLAALGWDGRVGWADPPAAG